MVYCIIWYFKQIYLYIHTHSKINKVNNLVLRVHDLMNELNYKHQALCSENAKAAGYCGTADVKKSDLILDLFF